MLVRLARYTEGLVTERKSFRPGFKLGCAVCLCLDGWTFPIEMRRALSLVTVSKKEENNLLGKHSFLAIAPHFYFQRTDSCLAIPSTTHGLRGSQHRAT